MATKTRVSANRHSKSITKASVKKRQKLLPLHEAKRVVRGRRKAHTQLLLHPMSVFFLLLVGVLLVGSTIQAFADDLVVTARIEAPTLATGATLDSPRDGAVFTTKPITVSGSCPDESYVKLFRNGMFSGVDACVSQSYSIDTDLFPGKNTLKVHAYNLTDLPGPDTPAIDVTYAPPVTTSPTPGKPTSVSPKYIPPSRPSENPPPPGVPLLIWSDYRFQVVSTKEKFTWKLQIQSGTSPYRVTIDWRDRATTKRTITTNTEFTISHSYVKSGIYPIRITVQDGTVQSAFVQLVALVKEPGASGTISSILVDPTTRGGTTSYSSSWLWFAWPTYAVMLLMIFSFWLGERREYLQLTHDPRPRLKHSHR